MPSHSGGNWLLASGSLDSEIFIDITLQLMEVAHVSHFGCWTYRFHHGMLDQVSTPGQALIHNQKQEDVFDIVTQAFSEAEFIILSVNELSGFISARRPKGIMNNKDTLINCTVRGSAGGVVKVDVTSTVSGQLVAYGATTDAIRVFFKKLLIHLPEAKLTMDGKPFDPNKAAQDSD